MRISDWSSDVCSSDLRVPSGWNAACCAGSARAVERLGKLRKRRNDREGHDKTKPRETERMTKGAITRRQFAAMAGAGAVVYFSPLGRGTARAAVKITHAEAVENLSRSEERRVGKESVNRGRQRG